MGTLLLGLILAVPPGAVETAAPDPVPNEESAEADLVITGSRAPQRRSDTVVAVEVLDADTIARSGARTAGDLFERIGGASVNRSFAGTGVALQGLSERHTLILIDGERATGKTNGVLDLDRIRVRDIERVEIVRGAASSLYGADAIGGVINIITRDAPPDWSAEVTALGASDTATDLSGSVGAPLGPAILRFSGGWHRAPSYDLDESDAATDGSATDDLDLAHRTRLILSSAASLTLDATHALRRSDRVESEDSGAILDRTRQERASAVALSGRWRVGSVRLRGSARFDDIDAQVRRDQRGADALDGFDETHNQQVTANTQVGLNLAPGHQLTTGLDGLHESIETTRIERGEVDRQRGAAYAEYTWTPLFDPYVSVVAGGRVDLDSQFGAHPTPRLAARYDPHETVALRASAGLGFRAPDFKELYLLFENPSAGYVVAGNPDLQPETSVSVQASVTWQPSPLLDLRVGGFRNDVDDLISIETTPASGGPGLVPYRYGNIESARTQGVEAEAAVRPLPFNEIRVGYTGMQARNLELDRQLQGRSSHQLHGELVAGIPSVVASARFVWHSERFFYPAPDVTERTPAYGDLTARLGWQAHDQLKLFVLAENLLGAGEPEYLTLRPRRFGLGLTANL